MPEFAPITDLVALGLQDDGEMAAGFYAGSNGFPEPTASVFSRSYIHGWRAGAMQAGRLPQDSAFLILEHSLDIARACADQVGLASTPFRMPIQ